jgi:CheY-like chemotaxis protein
MASVLIADDEADIRYVLRRIVEATSGLLAVVGEAASGEEAVDLWRRLRPDAVVLDHRMPGVTGLEAAAQILDEQPDQVIVLFSAFRDDAVTHRCAELGVKACLGKADVPRLIDVLLEHLHLTGSPESEGTRPEPQ